jgi:septum formation protein
LLRQAGISFRVSPSLYQEGRPQGRPGAYAKAAALGKAREVVSRTKSEAWVLGADTLVVSGNFVFGKPRNRAEAVSMLRRLSGRTHAVVTGTALVHAPTGKAISWVEKTKVTMRRIGGQELERYLVSGEWRDKAGAYGIQGRAGAWVVRVEGCYFNVVGLPLGAVCEQLQVLGIRLR